MAIAVILGMLAVVVVVLLIVQRQMIYYPSTYEKLYKRMLPKASVELGYETSQGKQTAFYVPVGGGEPDAAPPERLWVLFGGNASKGLDWLDLVESYARQPGADETSSTGFLLIDYPGFGLCQGKPTRQGIVESSEAAFGALARHFQTPPSKLEDDLNVLGLSIGTAAGLEFASRHRVQQIILLAPFTSMMDMARRTVGTPLCHLLYDRFDNRARIQELTKRSPAPRIDIFHGSADMLVPSWMGKQLAELGAPSARFHPVKDTTHDTILLATEKQVIDLMVQGAPATDEERKATPR